MLKHSVLGLSFDYSYQPPSGGCVLKQNYTDRGKDTQSQPPSGGCVLKLLYLIVSDNALCPAAFGRLCVETKLLNDSGAMSGTSRLRAAVC